MLMYQGSIPCSTRHWNDQRRAGEPHWEADLGSPCEFCDKSEFRQRNRHTELQSSHSTGNGSLEGVPQGKLELLEATGGKGDKSIGNTPLSALYCSWNNIYIYYVLHNCWGFYLGLLKYRTSWKGTALPEDWWLGCTEFSLSHKTKHWRKMAAHRAWYYLEQCSCCAQSNTFLLII